MNKKERISATVSPETIKEIDEILKKGNQRNKSHVIEEAVKLFYKASKNGDFYEEKNKKYCLICLDEK